VNNFKDFCLGSAQFGMDYGYGDSKKVQEKYIEQIINFYEENLGIEIDTAKAYGKSEKIISKFINKSKVTTKVLFSKDQKKIQKDVEDSLNIFGEKLDAVLIHNPNYLKECPNAIETINKIKNDFNLNNIGISIYSFQDIISSYTDTEEVLEVMNKVQISCNVFNKNDIESEFFDELIKNNIKIDFRSIFLQGALLDKKISSEIKQNEFSDFFDIWYEYCDINELKPIEAAILNLPKTNGKIIFGCRNINQLRELLSIRHTQAPLLKLKENPPKDLTDPRLW
jgi:aryl-alcohol dehydrogenase-like predicted oxidoreductase